VTGSATQSEGAVFADRPFVSRSFLEPGRIDVVAEAERYLAAVELFRIEGCEPDWRREPLPPADRN
jgi:hypothetical protein